MIKKKQILPSCANRLINNGCTVLVSCQHDGAPNIITVAWQTPVSHNPPVMAIAVGKRRYSHDLILNNGQFGVNIPSANQLALVEICGRTSGRHTDKFKLAKVTPQQAVQITVPLIAECIAHLECKVIDNLSVGDHTLFLGEIVAASANEGVFENYLVLNRNENKTLHHLGSQYYMISGDRFQYEDQH